MDRLSGIETYIVYHMRLVWILFCKIVKKLAMRNICRFNFHEYIVSLAVFLAD